MKFSPLLSYHMQTGPALTDSFWFLTALPYKLFTACLPPHPYCRRNTKSDLPCEFMNPNISLPQSTGSGMGASSTIGTKYPSRVISEVSAGYPSYRSWGATHVSQSFHPIDFSDVPSWITLYPSCPPRNSLKVEYTCCMCRDANFSQLAKLIQYHIGESTKSWLRPLFSKWAILPCVFSTKPVGSRSKKPRDRYMLNIFDNERSRSAQYRHRKQLLFLPMTLKH